MDYTSSCLSQGLRYGINCILSRLLQEGVPRETVASNGGYSHYNPRE